MTVGTSVGACATKANSVRHVSQRSLGAEGETKGPPAEEEGRPHEEEDDAVGKHEADEAA